MNQYTIIQLENIKVLQIKNMPLFLGFSLFESSFFTVWEKIFFKNFRTNCFFTTAENVRLDKQSAEISHLWGFSRLAVSYIINVRILLK